MSTRPILISVACVLACSCSVPARRAPTSAPQASDFEAAISGIRQRTPTSPALINAQLGYGEFLLSEARGPCEKRLVLAQEQLGSVDASKKTHVMYPHGWARAADLEYRLHLARAQCGSEDPRGDLLAAAAAARRAVGLYRDAFEYHSMVIMQFNVGVALHQLDDVAGALAALETALKMDREYGFEDDARENYQLLLTWRGEPAGAAQVAALMQDFPRRQAILKFGWHAGTALTTFETRRDCLKDGQILHSRAAAAFERRIGVEPAGGWSVSYAHRLTEYEPGVWPTGQAPQLTLPPVLLPAVAFRVSSIGEFQGATDAKTFAAQLIARTDVLIRAGALPGDDAQDVMSDAVETTAYRFSPGMLEAGTAESYQLETAMWIGAKIDQGVWYEMSAPLSLPGMPEFVVQQHIEFAFTRNVHCSVGAPDRKCIEIVLHAIPDPKELHDVIADLKGDYPGSPSMSYDASIDARIVVDPATLLSYAREEQIHWYASIGKHQGESVLWSEHLVSTMKYESH